MSLVTPVAPVPLRELGRVHFVGIGGAGMSGIARIMLARGVPVSGSDQAPSPQLDELAALGAEVRVGHAAQNLGAADTLVVTTAIRPDNPELAAARRRGIPVVHRAAALASVMLGKQGIAVAGTHGKTTTTSMLTTVLRQCGADPSYVIGGILAETGVGAADGTGEMFVAEADESDGSFLMLAPRAAVITSIEADHLDNYASLAEIEASFSAFAGRISADGVLVACADDRGAAALAASAGGSGGSSRRGAAPTGLRSEERERRAGRAGGASQRPGGDREAPSPWASTAGGSLRAVTYGTSASASYRVSDITPEGMGTGLTLTIPGGPAVRVRIGVPGRHNALNAAAAFAMATELGFPAGQLARGLAGYRGTRRRMEPKGEADGVRVLDSYAHHPTELRADLTAARDVAVGGRVIAVFQPHLYSRTRIFAAEFGSALGLADEVIVLDVYAAREDPEPGVTGYLVAAAVPGRRARFLPDAAAVPDAVAAVAKPGDLVLTMGAGDVTALGPQILAALAERGGAVR